LAVLVDGKTQAAELLAGAIKRNKRGTLIGHSTSGQTASKALVKGPDGSSRLVAHGTFLMSPGQPISGVGVAPDCELPAGAESAEFVRRAITELQQASAAKPRP
jgi:carboxyl-terminal processing protease